MKHVIEWDRRRRQVIQKTGRHVDRRLTPSEFLQIRLATIKDRLRAGVLVLDATLVPPPRRS